VTAYKRLECLGVAADGAGGQGGVSWLGHSRSPYGTTRSGTIDARWTRRHSDHTDVDERSRRY
jgi:hypothetical protein